MNAPRYAVYFMLDDPKGNKSTGFFSTAGAVSAPGAGRVIARIGPMLGLFPDLQDKAAIDASLDDPAAAGSTAGRANPHRAADDDGGRARCRSRERRCRRCITRPPRRRRRRRRRRSATAPTPGRRAATSLRLADMLRGIGAGGGDGGGVRAPWRSRA